MSAINTFIQLFSAQYAQRRGELTNTLSIEKGRILDEYTKSMNHVAGLEERYTALVAPLVQSLSALPENIVIDAIKFSADAAPEVLLSTTLGASMASLLMEYPAMPFAIADDGIMRDPGASKNNDAVYSGILVSPKFLLTQWQTTLGEQSVNISCKTDEATIERWNNPLGTGAPVATIHIGDMGGSPLWHSIVRDGTEYWVQPVNSVALDKLNKASSWLDKTLLSTSVRQDFNAQLEGLRSLQSPQAKIVVNALFAWATSEQELPAKEDFSVWTAPRGNVLAMHSAQDWTDLLSDASREAGVRTPAQEKIHVLSERLPNIWRFTDESGIAILCEAMAAARMRLQANLSPSI